MVLVAASASLTGLTALGLKGLRQTAIPAYLIVGAGDTATPPKENAEFAAKYIPHAQLDVLPGPVGHEIFDNACDQVETIIPTPVSTPLAWIEPSCMSTSGTSR